MKNDSNKLVLHNKSQVSIRCHQINFMLSIGERTFIKIYVYKKKNSNKSRLSVGNSFIVLNEFISEIT